MSFKKYSKAKELFEEYLKTSPEDQEVKEMLQKAVTVLEKVIASSPNAFGVLAIFS